MQEITRLTDSAHQEFTLISNAGEEISFKLRYMPTQLSWYFDISDGIDFTLNGAYLGLGPNILRNFRNNISFGLGIASNDGFDPRDLDDFTAGRVQVFLLSAEEVLEIESAVYDV